MKEEEDYLGEDEEEFPEDGDLEPDLDSDEAAAAEPAEPAEPEEVGDDESLDDLINKRPEERPAPEGVEEESILSLDREERVESLSVLDLAPGGVPGRLTLWTESALSALGAKGAAA